MKRVIQTLAVLAVLALLGGAAVVFVGLYNVSARIGHFPGIYGVLHTTFRNSVELRAPKAAEVPDLDAAGMVALGAKHYDSGCKVCHAAPGQERWAVPKAMNPQPPHIRNAVGTWRPQELHWIVDEGVKMSGMPYWPATRTDDIWPVVAFLDAVQDGMNGQVYNELTAKPAVAGAPEALPYCAMCHGTDGRSDNPLIPRLDIQPQAYLEQTLRAYASGSRNSGIMAVAASSVSEADLMEMAAWFAAQPVTAGRATMDSNLNLLAEGEALANRGTQDVPACTACHGPKSEPRAAHFPHLAGQSEIYLAEQLRLWRAGNRGGGNRAHLMTKAAQDLSDEEIAALAAWFAAQPAAD